MTDIVERLRKRQMMQDVRGTGDRFVKQVAVPDALCQLAADEIERLRDERDALRADAERYRWLRDGCNNKDSPATRIAAKCYGLEWDAAIDAAMAAQTTDRQEAVK